MKRWLFLSLISVLLIIFSSMPALNAAPVKTACAMCGKPVHLQLMTGVAMGEVSQYFCCPHCAIMSLTLQPEKAAQAKVTVTDYPTGEALPAEQAVFVLDTGSVLCCAPAILAFKTQGAAKAYGKGTVMTWAEIFTEISHCRYCPNSRPKEGELKR